MITANLVKELRDKTGVGMMDCKKALTECSGDMTLALDWLREKGIATAQKKADRIAAEGLASSNIEGNKAIILEINSETDFVAKNETFQSLVEQIETAILTNTVNTLEDALKITIDNETVENLIIGTTAKLGEKISLRRFIKLEKSETEVFGKYSHMGGKIVVLIKLEGGTELIAKEIAMHIAAMKPLYIAVEDVAADVLDKEKKILTEQAMNEGKPKEIAEKMVTGRINKFYKEICLLEQPFIKDDSISIKDYLKQNNAIVKEMLRYEVGEGIEKRNDNFAEEVMKQMK